jgi:hypothetical protein
MFEARLLQGSILKKVGSHARASFARICQTMSWRPLSVCACAVQIMDSLKDLVNEANFGAIAS